jgi:hypothetical protein
MTSKRHRFFAFVVFAGFSVVLLGQQHPKPDAKQPAEPSDNPPSTSAPPPRTEQADAPTQQTKPERSYQEGAPKTVRVLLPSKDLYDYILLGLNTVLAAVGVGGLLLASENLKKIGQQTGEIKRQADLMEQEIGILKESTETNRIAAEAAQRNVEALIAKERAHLRPLPESLNIVRVGATTQMEAVVRLKIVNYGATNAFIESAEAGIAVHESDLPEYDPLINFLPLPELLPGEAESNEFIFRLPIDQVRLGHGEVRVHLFGTISYRDVFLADPRETSFYFVWDQNRHEWERNGDEYNTQT